MVCRRVRGEWVRGEEVERGGGERSGGAVRTDVAGHQGRRGGQVTSHMTYVWHMSSVDWLCMERERGEQGPSIKELE